MPANERSTSELLHDWHQGCESALDELIRAVLPELQAYVRRQLGPQLRRRCQTEDIVGEAMIRLLRYLPRFTLTDKKQLLSLLCTLARNCILDDFDHFTSQCRDMRREQPLAPRTTLNLDPPAASSDRPSQVAEQSEMREWLWFGLAQLDPEERQLIILRQIEERPYEEIGRQLGITEEAARKRHDRALARLMARIRRWRQHGWQSG